MSHTIYQTEGIVLAKKDFGEADRMLTVFTKEFGMISAMAQGVRQLKSKLRYNLDLFSYGNFSLVAGRGIWRLTDAEEIKKIDSGNISLFSRIAGLLVRMIKGEEKNDFIWKKIKNIFLVGGEEVQAVAEILHNLGYMEKDSYATRKEAVSAINKAIKESML